MAEAPKNTRLVPGFDFLQGLVKNAGAALPNIGQWVAPTLDPQELEKRIEELRTVQFWLEQNARMLGATIQALEVQRMTLSTLQTMNVQMDDLRESLKIRAMPDKPAPAAEPLQPSAKSAPAKGGGKAARRPGAESPSAQKAAAVDPMQWWGALTQQFAELAASAMKDGAADAAANLAGAMAKQGLEAAAKTFDKAVETSAKSTRKDAAAARKRGKSTV